MKIKMKLHVFFYLILIFLFSSCKGFNNYKLYKAIKINNGKIEKSLILDDVFNHFETLDELDFISADFLVPPVNPSSYYVRSQRAYSIVICSLKDSLLNAPKSFIYKTVASNINNFIVSMIFKEKVVFNKSHDIYYPNSYPIPDLGRYDFKLGFNQTDTIIGGKRYMHQRYIVPSDMEVYVQEAEHGCFWKEESDVYRPSSMKEWEHGYSKGTAISKEEKLIMFWFIVW